MDRDRFNTLLEDLDEITDADIKSLNQLRKQYPYFQSPYVLIAKALKTRNHPKADAFIKKAAIYSADRSLLKSIILGEHAFEQAEEVTAPSTPTVQEQKEEATSQSEEPVQKEEITEASAPTKEEKPVTETAVSPTDPKPAQTDEVAEKSAVIDTPTTVKENTSPAEDSEAEQSKEGTLNAPREDQPEEVTQVADQATEEDATAVVSPAAEKAADQSSPEPATPSTEEDVIGDLEKDLLEIRKKKQLIAKMLEQQEAKASGRKPKAAKKKAKAPRASQSELIEKFIRNEPQMGKQHLTEPENEHNQQDLAAKFTIESDEFHTETMAKLMVTQKKYKKAIHIYEKLVLKFPEKSRFFAAQIEKVKEKSNG